MKDFNRFVDFAAEHRLRLLIYNVIVGRRCGWAACLADVQIDGDSYPSAEGESPEAAVVALAAKLSGVKLSRRSAWSPPASPPEPVIAIFEAGP